MRLGPLIIITCRLYKQRISREEAVLEGRIVEVQEWVVDLVWRFLYFNRRLV